MTDQRPWGNEPAPGRRSIKQPLPGYPAARVRGNPVWWLGGLLSIAVLLAGCSSAGTSGRKAFLGVPLPGLSSKSTSEDAAFRKKVEKDPFPSAGSSSLKSGQFPGLR
jgi:hypothetical protein